MGSWMVWAEAGGGGVGESPRCLRCGRPCDHAARIPAVQVVQEPVPDIPVLSQRWVPTVLIVQDYVKFPLVQFLGQVFDAPVVVVDERALVCGHVAVDMVRAFSPRGLVLVVVAECVPSSPCWRKTARVCALIRLCGYGVRFATWFGANVFTAVGQHACADTAMWARILLSSPVVLVLITLMRQFTEAVQTNSPRFPRGNGLRIMRPTLALLRG